jgi:hypothetical protein
MYWDSSEPRTAQIHQPPLRWLYMHLCCKCTSLLRLDESTLKELGVANSVECGVPLFFSSVLLLRHTLASADRVVVSLLSLSKA